MPVSKHSARAPGASLLILTLAAALFGCGSDAHDHVMHESSNGEPVNFLVYDNTFSSAGMPDARFIKRLAEEGVDTVINVAPPTASGALKNEQQLVTAAQMTYLNIPVDWSAPTQNNVEQFLDFMKSRADDKVFLHCQMNMRATAFAMLHRVINQGVAPQEAMKDVHRIWQPNRVWATLMNTTLTHHNIDFVVEVPSE